MDTESIYECIGRIYYVANHPEGYGGPEKALARIRELVNKTARASAAVDFPFDTRMVDLKPADTGPEKGRG